MEKQDHKKDFILCETHHSFQEPNPSRTSFRVSLLSSAIIHKTPYFIPLSFECAQSKEYN